MCTLSTKQRDLNFLEACKSEDCHNVRKFILDGCDPILTQNEFGQNALHVASLHGNLDIVELLVKVYGCNPAIVDDNGRTALHLACMGGSVVVTDYLIKSGHDLETNTMLHYACLSGDVPTVRYVLHLLNDGQYLQKLNKYWDVTAPYFNRNASSVTTINVESALRTACRAGHLHVPVLRCFIEELQLDESLCKVFTSVSKLACQCGRYDTFMYLVDRGCCPTEFVSPTKSSDNICSLLPHPDPFHSQHGHTLQCMPVPSYRVVSGFRASALKPSLKFACQNGDEEMVRRLMEDYKCDPLVPDSDTGDTLLHSACMSGNLSLVNFVLKVFLDCQCDPMKQNKEGNTPLHEACRWGYLEIVEKLLDAKPSTINASNQLMESPLHLACSRKRSHIGKFLAGIDSCDVMSLNHLKETPLHVASCSSDYELIECILSKNKDALNCTDIYEDTPLFNACRVGDVNVVKLFVETGCDPSHVNSTTRELPIHIACRTGNVALFQCLKCCMNSESWHQANVFGQTPLHLVCEQGNLPLVNDILEHTSHELNVKDDRGMTPLLIACKINSAEIARVILAQPTVDVNIDNECGNTPLHLACYNENIDTVTLLMEHEPDITIRNKNGDTPVHTACKRGRLSILSKVLGTENHGLKFEFNNDGVTPLHIASSSGQFEMVKCLVNGEYCDPNVASKQANCTPLHFACFEGHKDIAMYLAECAPQTVSVCDVNGQCPVLLALQKKNYDVVKSLVPRYFDSNSKVSKSDVPLFLYCCEYGDTDLLKYLVSDAECNPTLLLPYGETTLHFIVEFIDPRADIDHKYLYVLEVCSSQINCVSNNGDTPLLHACKRDKNNAVSMLLEHNADPNCKDSAGEFPLHIACGSMKCDIMKTLLSYEADSSCKDSNGSTPLHIACRNRRREMVKVLLDFEADTSSQDSDGRTPLHITACDVASHDIMKMLLDNKADTTCQDSRGNTPLHIASRSREVTGLKLLLDYKADMSAQDSRGDTPLHLASRDGNKTHVQMLLDYKADTSCKNLEGKTPIQVTSSYDITMMLIDYGANPQDIYTHYGEVLEKCKQEQPLHDMVKILVVGKALAGKTTLVEALKQEGIHVTLVDNVTERTAGIVSTQFKSDKLGYVTFHDFAGQQEFYSSHSQFLLSNLLADAVVLLLINALDEDSKLVKNISYWMSFVRHHCSNADCLPQIVVICSHMDELENIKDAKELKLKQAMQKYPCLGPVFLDCRNPACEGMHQLKNLLGDVCEKVRSNVELNCQCHVLFVFMHTQFQNTVELCEVQRAIKKIRTTFSYLKKDSRDPGNLLPHATPSLLHLLKTLHQKGHILLLKDEIQEDNYWIVFRQDIFNETVHGTLFAPTTGPISNVGVVPLSVLKKIFFEHTTDMRLIVKYLVYKEFCHKIDDTETLKLISSETNFPLESQTTALLESDTELYFFPCFVQVEKQNKVWRQRDEQSYSCGWCLECDEHFTTNFLHVLLLRLTFKYGAFCKDVPATSLFTRRCDIWKNGIHWFTTEGVEVLVELTHSLTFLLVLIRSLDESMTMKCVKLRASIIRTIFDVLEKTCPGLKPSESLICHDLQNYPDCDLMSAEKISIQEVAETIKKGDPFGYSSMGELIKLEKLLFFEPYCSIGESLLSLLYKNNEEEMPSNYVLKLSQCFSSRTDKLEYILNVSPVDSADIHAHQVCQKNSELIPHRVIEHWKISTPTGSYSDLREAFDRYSIFGGRNPLTLCN